MKVELFWFEDCPNHEFAEAMLKEVQVENGVEVRIDRIEVPDLVIGNRVTFPGSPTIRINDIDIKPGWEVCEDCTPRCRVYYADGTFSGLPQRE